MRLAPRLAILLIPICIATGSSALAALEEPVGASSSNRIPLEQCTEPSFVRAPDGTYRQSFDAVEAQGALAAIPPRTAAEVGAGESTKVCVGFQNRTDETISLRLSKFDVGVDRDGAPLTGGTTDYGAASWLSLPTTEVRDLERGDVAWMVVDVEVPTDASAGSWYASIQATLPGKKAQGSGVQITQSKSVASQVFFDIPGEVERGGRVTNIRSPRIVWWDGLGLGELPVLEDLRGLGVAPIRFDWKNTGDYTDVIGGTIDIRSDLGGRRVTTLKLEPQTVLRGAERPYASTWSDDVPLLGRFTPTLKMRRDDGHTETVELDPIWVIPSWTYLLALAIAIGVPVWLRRRSRERYEALLARLEAAEARAEDPEFDGGAWDEGDDWDSSR